MVVHNETSTGATSRVADIRKAIDRAKHPALFMVDTISSLASIAYEHDAWGVDVTVAGSQKGLMLPPGLGFNAVSDKALAAAKANTVEPLVLGLARDHRRQQGRQLALHARDQHALRPEGSDRDAARGGAGQRVRAAPAPRGGGARRGPWLEPGDPVRRAARAFADPDRGDDAGRPRRRSLPPGDAGAFRHVARRRACRS